MKPGPKVAASRTCKKGSSLLAPAPGFSRSTTVWPAYLRSLPPKARAPLCAFQNQVDHATKVNKAATTQAGNRRNSRNQAPRTWTTTELLSVCQEHRLDDRPQLQSASLDSLYTVLINSSLTKLKRVVRHLSGDHWPGATGRDRLVEYIMTTVEGGSSFLLDRQRLSEQEASTKGTDNAQTNTNTLLQLCDNILQSARETNAALSSVVHTKELRAHVPPAPKLENPSWESILAQLDCLQSSAKEIALLLDETATSASPAAAAMPVLEAATTSNRPVVVVSLEGEAESGALSHSELKELWSGLGLSNERRNNLNLQQLTDGIAQRVSIITAEQAGAAPVEYPLNYLQSLPIEELRRICQSRGMKMESSATTESLALELFTKQQADATPKQAPVNFRRDPAVNKGRIVSGKRMSGSRQKATPNAPARNAPVEREPALAMAGAASSSVFFVHMQELPEVLPAKPETPAAKPARNRTTRGKAAAAGVQPSDAATAVAAGEAVSKAVGTTAKSTRQRTTSPKNASKPAASAVAAQAETSAAQEPAPQAAAVGGYTEGELQAKTVVQLREMWKAAGLKNASRKRKDELVKGLVQATAENAN